MLKDNAGKISGNTFRVVNFSNADKPFSGMAVTGEKRGRLHYVFVPGGASSFVFHW